MFPEVKANISTAKKAVLYVKVFLIQYINQPMKDK